MTWPSAQEDICLDFAPVMGDSCECATEVTELFEAAGIPAVVRSLGPSNSPTKVNEMIGRIRISVPLRPTWGAAIQCAVLACAVCGGHIRATDEPGKNKEDEARREEQLKNLKRSAAQYTVYPAGDRKLPYKFHEDPLIRFSNPITGCKDGTYYIWVDRGRPQAIVKVFTYDNELYSYEWHSLSERAIVAERDGTSVWSPNDPGVTFRELAGAPAPAESAAERLRQMKSLAGKFTATYSDNLNLKALDLRLLVQPVFRYEAGNKARDSDGTVFAFANGTNPMAILVLEARQAGESLKWHYSFARTSRGAVTARYNEHEIYSVDKYDHSKGPTQTFFFLPNQQAPKE
jgi:hypothetical protein